jgi:peptide/nickel transport system substrate-binding protein
MEIMQPTRRQTLAMGASAFLGELLFAGAGAVAATKDTLTIAFNVNVPSFDPTSGPSAVNPTIQAIYRSIFDQYIGQKPDLSFVPGLLTAWGWNDDKTKIWMDVRSGVTWHDGSPFGPADVVFSLERAGKKDGGNPVRPSSSGWRSSPATCCRKPTTKKWGPKGSKRSRSAPAPIWSLSIRAMPSSA